MGYTTRFQGGLKLNRELTHREWLDLTELGNCYDTNVYERYTGTPETMPESYNQWVPNDIGTEIVWNGGEKFYNYTHWLRWLIKHYLKPQGLVLDGKIEWQGEELDDRGVLYADANKITTKKIAVGNIIECPHCGERFVKEND